MKAPVTAPPEIRCRDCNRLLARGELEAGEIELQCPRLQNPPASEGHAPQPSAA